MRRIGCAVAETESSGADVYKRQIYVRPDSPILKAKGANPRYPDVYGSADTVRGKLTLCPEKTSAHYLLLSLIHIYLVTFYATTAYCHLP